MKKTAVVSGANRGIGLAFCRQLVSEGYHVVGLCRQSSLELDGLGVAVLENVDVANVEQVQDMGRRLDIDQVDLLINNAGIGTDDDLEHIDFTEVKRHLLTNAFGPLCVTLALLSRMRPGGKIALITSRLSSIADNASGRSYGYRMSKAALNMLGKNLSLDLKERGIAVALLSPGMVDTDMLRALGVTTGAEVSGVVRRLMVLIHKLSLDNTGTFWHVDGHIMPW